jgi:hypothetical protein
MNNADVAFIVSALAAAFIIGCSYVSLLRFFGLVRGNPRDYDGYIKWAWFVVWVGFIIGVAFTVD